MILSDLDDLRKMAERATPGPWEVQDGCSWRRIGDRRHDGNVICPTKHWKDGHPDLIARREDLDFIAACHPQLVLSLIDTLKRVTQQRDEARERYDREVLGLNNEGDPIGGDPPRGMKHRVERAEAEIKHLHSGIDDLLAAYPGSLTEWSDAVRALLPSCPRS